jgi:hypothetical protein
MVVIVASAAIVSACSTSDRETIVIPEFVERETPAEAKVPCPLPVPLPDRDLSEKEASDYWGADRTALRICEARRAAAVGGSNVQ